LWFGAEIGDYLGYVFGGFDSGDVGVVIAGLDLFDSGVVGGLNVIGSGSSTHAITTSPRFFASRISSSKSIKLIC
jgi:hypothetical protein